MAITIGPRPSRLVAFTSRARSIIRLALNTGSITNEHPEASTWERSTNWPLIWKRGRDDRHRSSGRVYSAAATLRPMLVAYLCEIVQPLGKPVVPDVYMMAWVDLGSTVSKV